MKLGLVFLCLISITVGCQQEDYETEQSSETLKKSPFSMRIASKEEIKQNIGISDHLKKLSPKTKSNMLHRDVHNSDYDFIVNTDFSKYIESEDGSFHSYTFLIEREEDNGLVENLVCL
ncbi:hypothetical protein [uncultured Psychroserpens sp.]|uniref:hypothetical protein n=1 Tax=uncultured Psychroserpens sp. TaxID=255436 RepID=UPI002608253A|nr:hypothetical protein [uncultured Psychroserpens sp.]